MSMAGKTGVPVNTSRRRTAALAGAAAAVLLLASCSDSGKDNGQDSGARPGNTAPVAEGPATGNPPTPAGTPPPFGSDLKDYWSGRANLSVFLCTRTDPPQGGCSGGAVTEGQSAEIQRVLTNAPGVASVSYESKDNAYRHFREMNKDSALAANLTPDQFPDSFRVRLTDPAQYAAVEALVQETPGVQDVRPIA
ncbi:permease-like cell division protein FtsX [Yinghuangia sp. YIM S09857]|uniref:permease-like cell division protein FtsX n=1 Tax=Yinghuangia sp. YIM S09857 TaxID=3436929 RepID=UPI003F539832